MCLFFDFSTLKNKPDWLIFFQNPTHWAGIPTILTYLTTSLEIYFAILVYFDFDYVWSISRLVGIKGMNVHMYHHLSVWNFRKTLISQVWSAGGWNHYFHSLFANCCSHYPKFWWLFNISKVILFPWQIFFPQPQCKNSYILSLKDGAIWSCNNFEIPTFFQIDCRQIWRKKNHPVFNTPVQ